MMFCTQCGKKIQDDAKFCPYCGATILPPSDSKKQDNHPYESPKSSPSPSRSKVRKLWPSDRKQRVRIWNRFVAAVIAGIMGIALYDGLNTTEVEKQQPEPVKQEEHQSQPAPVKEQKPVKLPAPASIANFEVDENVIGEPVAYIQIKNDSDKTIDGFKVRLSARDNFGQEVTEFGYGDPFTVLMSQHTIEPRGLSSDSYHWTLHGLENGRKFHVELAEIHYTNGTSWNSSWSDPVTADTKQTGVQV
ncbi:zinc ribbon domain-containing protein [Megasphaera sp.]|uniref:zinc ribbon domain-containing protein n=1 Tax=Megasphaera TaxID=906 RepID=UPI001DB1C53D|nr:zinc ribbon domain-containing protein [Megasphaera sp.]MBS6791278.1 zinc-ribbon domain-containing protein [Megasphaera sp.]